MANTPLRVIDTEDCDDAAAGIQPAGAGGAQLPDRTADAPVRDLHDTARAWQGAQHQAELRLAVLGRRGAPEARADQCSGDDARGTAPRAHRLRDHRRGTRRIRELAGGTALDTRA